ncbi:methyl-accepting chemotaxis protein [Bordetella sp. 15P40C-2]|uniref:methyl-accepting chemotaxis protein n=1 Tax=Bordetella sp. 15P40C-2 TaxID=2572246 RepID=UPI001325400F|nr:methyl-accepting chemotaxis protein [Bordetella sp. 15P40C-2]MVW69972.1 methyl-accepting chemotaxis protein [Bordetella sp. 15P40C-2]
MSVRKSIAVVVAAFLASGFVLLVAFAGLLGQEGATVADAGTAAAANDAQARAAWYVGLSIAFIVLASAGLACYLRQAFLVPLKRLHAALLEPLQATSKHGGQEPTANWVSLQESVNELAQAHTRALEQWRAALGEIATQSDTIVQHTIDLGSRAQDQASALQQTAASMQELSSTVTQTADNAREADVLARSASEVAQKGGEVMKEVVQTMDGISTHSRKVSEIVSVIDRIAFQTNILALNAAVEAARAGEQGKGFSVVASEVRNLASRSAQAAKEVKTLIDQATNEVENGHALVEHAGRTMSDIVDSIGKVTNIMGEIASASNEQASGIDQINQAVSQMDDVMQRNAGLVQQAGNQAILLKDKALGLIGGGKVAMASSQATSRSEKGESVAKPKTKASKRSPREAAASSAAPRKEQRTPTATPATSAPDTSATAPSNAKIMSPVTGNHAAMDEWESF